MKKKIIVSIGATLKTYIACSVLLLVLPAAVRAQADTTLFVVVDFMKVQSQSHSRYLEVEQEIWKPMQQERIVRGTIVGWFLYAVEFSGSGDEYNYVTITLYDNPEELENPWMADIPGKVLPGMKPEEIMKRTYESREHIKSELYYSVATAPQIPLEKPAAYMQVNFMKVAPDMHAAYEALESEIWLPIHNESIRSGRTTGWSLWSSLFPRGAARPYQYITLNSFSEYSYIFELDFSVPFRSIHPDVDYNEMQERTWQTRTIVRTELWDLIDYVIR